jgi:hypothetical protein
MPPILSQRIGIFSKIAHDVGILIKDVPGTSGIQPNTLTVLVSNVNPLDPSSANYSIQCFPGSKFEDETDSNGNISVLSTWTALDGPLGTSWGLSGGGSFNFVDGIWGQKFRAVLASGGATIPLNEAYLDITMSSDDPTEYPNVLPGSPPVITGQQNPQWNEEEEEGKVDLTFTYDLETVDGLFFEYSENGVDWFTDGYAQSGDIYTTFFY